MSLAAAYMLGRKRGATIDASDFISYWKFDGNANDSVGTNNGTATNVTYPTGLIGNCADFSGFSTARVVVPDSNDLSFGNGMMDIDFSTITLIKFNDLLSFPRVMHKMNTNDTDSEYRILVENTGKVQIAIFDSSSGGFIRTRNTKILTESTWYVFTTTYKASTKELKFYVDNEITLDQLTGNPYTAMENGTGDLYIGQRPSAIEGNDLNGQINALSFLNVELTSDQVEFVVNKLKVENQHLI